MNSDPPSSHYGSGSHPNGSTLTNDPSGTPRLQHTSGILNVISEDIDTVGTDVVAERQLPMELQVQLEDNFEECITSSMPQPRNVSRMSVLDPRGIGVGDGEHRWAQLVGMGVARQAVLPLVCSRKRFSRRVRHGGWRGWLQERRLWLLFWKWGRSWRHEEGRGWLQS